MNGALVQEIVAFAVVGVAAAWLIVRRVRRKAKPTPYCGDCPSCEVAPVVNVAPASGLISIGELTKRQ
jgi:hypothetical protein